MITGNYLMRNLINKMNNLFQEELSGNIIMSRNN